MRPWRIRNGHSALTAEAMIPSTMQAMIFERTGGPEVFRSATVPTPQPGPDDVLIQVACAGVNPADWKNREGLLAAFRPYEFPCIIGFDAAGIVAAVGGNVTEFAPGDRVFSPTNHGQGGPGSYAQYTLASADKVAHIPPGLEFHQAAALPVAALTAWQALFERAAVAQGNKVLVHGGAGGVGSFAVQFARWAGVSVAATCSGHNAQYLESLGVEYVIDYRAQAIGEALREWAPAGVNCVIDAVGASTLAGALELLCPEGTLVSIATLVDDGDLESTAERAAELGVKHAYAIMEDTDCAKTLAQIAQLLLSGDIQLPPIDEYPVQEVASVHQQVQQGHTCGKRILRVAQL